MRSANIIRFPDIELHDRSTSMQSDIADQIAFIFEHNYPPYHNYYQHYHDLETMRDGQAVINTLFQPRHGGGYYVASTDRQVDAFLKWRTVPAEGGTYEQITWLMTDAAQRGRKLASLLHRAFIVDASERALARHTPTEATLNVHVENPARQIYQHWGYRAVQLAAADMVIMTKRLPE